MSVRERKGVGFRFLSQEFHKGGRGERIGFRFYVEDCKGGA